MENIHATQDWVKENYIKNISNALKGISIGEAISITDISPIEYNMEISVRKGNLLPYPYFEGTKTINGVTFTDNGDGTITLNGTATAYISYNLTNKGGSELKPNTTYSFYGFSDGSSSTYEIRVTDNKTQAYSSFSKPTTFSYEDISYFQVYLYIRTGSTFDNYVVKPIIREGIYTSLPYTPHIEDISKVKLYKQGKNLISPLTTETTSTPFTFDATKKDGSIVIDGVGDGSSYSIRTLKKGEKLDEILIDGETYTFALDVSGKKSIRLVMNATKIANNSTVYFQAQNANNFIYTITVDKSTYKYEELYIQINPTSEIYENVVVKPILAFGTYTTLPFVPYIEPTVHDVPSDGIVEGVTSLYPNTTLYTDTQGALIECEYNRDINKAFAELQNAIISLGNNI